MHSAKYEEGYDLKGKKVAVIGAGSSGVQIVAAIQKEVDTLYHWVRSPIWITAAFGHSWSGKDGANFACTSPGLSLIKPLRDHRFQRTAGLPRKEPKEVP